MIDEPEIKFLDRIEVFMVHGSLVASQRAYTMAFMKDDYRETRHFYCPKCGEVWGMRTVIQETNTRHKFYESLCGDCGGSFDMLSTFEWRRLDLLHPSVLAHHFIHQTSEV